MYVSFAYNVRVKWKRMLFKVPRYDQMFPHCPSNIDLFMNKSNIMLIRPVGNPVLIDQFICFHSDMGEIFWVARWGLRSQCSDHNSPTGTCLLHLSRRTLETGLFCPPPQNKNVRCLFRYNLLFLNLFRSEINGRHQPLMTNVNSLKDVDFTWPRANAFAFLERWSNDRL